MYSSRYGVVWMHTSVDLIALLVETPLFANGPTLTVPWSCITTCLCTLSRSPAGAAALLAAKAEGRCGKGTATQEGDHSQDWHVRDAEEVLCCASAEGH